MATTSSQPKLLVIVGPTASGKSDLALTVAKRFAGEIISADSLTVRQEISIGAAKPSPTVQAQIPHHLLDVVKPCQEFTAATFKRLATAAIAAIASQGKLPILVGGSGLYIDSVLYNFKFLPPGPANERSQLNSLSLAELQEQISRRGISTEGIDIQNKRRLIRRLETGGALPSRTKLRPNTSIFGLNPPAKQLKSKIEIRTRQMIEDGLEAEVRALVDKYGWTCAGLQAIGYREWRQYFENRQTLAETESKIIKSTMALAKKQRTWFARHPEIEWFESSEKALAAISRKRKEN